MTRTLRILVLDTNRYRSLLLERALARQVESAMVARFSSATAVVRELLDTRYDVAYVNLEGVERPIDLIQTVRLARPQLKLVMAGPPETPRGVVGAMWDLVDQYLVQEANADQLRQSVSAIVTACGASQAGPDHLRSKREPVLVG